jgi:hypothetical protein
VLRLERYPLRFSLGLEKVRGGLQGISPSGRTASNHSTFDPGAGWDVRLKRGIRSSLRVLGEWLTDYLLPYRLGPLLPGPRPGEPQTLIVVARKAGAGGSLP